MPPLSAASDGDDAPGVPAAVIHFLHQHLKEWMDSDRSRQGALEQAAAEVCQKALGEDFETPPDFAEVGCFL